MFIGKEKRRLSENNRSKRKNLLAEMENITNEGKIIIATPLESAGNFIIIGKISNKERYKNKNKSLNEKNGKIAG